MKLSMMITNNTPVKILGGFALGALLLGATALTQGTNNPVTGEGKVGPAAPVTLGEEWYHPITGEMNVGSAALVTLGEEFFHPSLPTS